MVKAKHAKIQKKWDSFSQPTYDRVNYVELMKSMLDELYNNIVPNEMKFCTILRLVILVVVRC